MAPSVRNPPWLTLAAVAAVVVLPLAAYVAWPHLPALRRLPGRHVGVSRFASSALPLERVLIGPQGETLPQLTNVRVVDLDADGLGDVLVCDSRRNQVLWYRQASGGRFDEIAIGDDLVDPAHAAPVDLDGDGDLDVVVAVLGDLMPNDEHVGRIVWLRNDGQAFTSVLLLDDVRRVADVQAADLDADGDVDLVAAVFGYALGQVLWLENLGDETFREHELLFVPGTIHVPLADYDGDGDLDIATVASQDEEEVWGLENLGGGRFAPRRLWFTVNHDIGSAGLVSADLDADGDADLLLPVGDNFEDRNAYPQEYHGCLWLENQGNWEFAERRIADFGGTYAADVADLDGDGDLDVVLVSMCNEWETAGSASLVWLENAGRGDFRTWQIDDRPIHLITVACGDLDGDGRADVVAGRCAHFDLPGRSDRLCAWLSGSGGRS
jgi:hypothetical protein